MKRTVYEIGKQKNVGFETMKILNFNKLSTALPSALVELAENRVFVYGRVRRDGTECGKVLSSSDSNFLLLISGTDHIDLPLYMP